MSYKPDENDLMAYLYGELEGSEKEAMDKYLFEHPEARVELERLQQMRIMLSHVKDKEVIAPPIFVGESKQRFIWNAPYLKTIVSIAASLLLIILVGKLAGMKIQYQESDYALASVGIRLLPVMPHKPLDACNFFRDSRGGSVHDQCILRQKQSCHAVQLEGNAATIRCIHHEKPRAEFQ